MTFLLDQPLVDRALVPPSARIKHPYIGIVSAKVKYHLPKQRCDAGVSARIWTK